MRPPPFLAVQARSTARACGTRGPSVCPAFLWSCVHARSRPEPLQSTRFRTQQCAISGARSRCEPKKNRFCRLWGSGAGLSAIREATSFLVCSALLPLPRLLIALLCRLADRDPPHTRTRRDVPRLACPCHVPSLCALPHAHMLCTDGPRGFDNSESSASWPCGPSEHMPAPGNLHSEVTANIPGWDSRQRAGSD